MSIDPREAARRKDVETYREPKRAAQRVVDADFGMVDEEDARIVARALLAGEGPSIRDAALEAIDAIKSATISPAVRDAPLREALENLRRRCMMILPSDSDGSKLARLIERDITAALSQ